MKLGAVKNNMVMKDNKEKEKKPIFNIIDLIILIFIVLAVVGIVMRYNLADKVNLNANGETFRIEFMTSENIQKASQKYFREGVSFYMTVEGVKIGEITGIIDVRDPAVWYSEKVDGKIIKTELPGRIDVRGVMVSAGRTTSEGVMLNGNMFVAPNKELKVQTGEWEGSIRVINVEKIDK